MFTIKRTNAHTHPHTHTTHMHTQSSLGKRRRQKGKWVPTAEELYWLLTEFIYFLYVSGQNFGDEQMYGWLRMVGWRLACKVVLQWTQQQQLLQEVRWCSAAAASWPANIYCTVSNNEKLVVCCCLPLFILLQQLTTVTTTTTRTTTSCSSRGFREGVHTQTLCSELLGVFATLRLLWLARVASGSGGGCASLWWGECSLHYFSLIFALLTSRPALLTVVKSAFNCSRDCTQANAHIHICTHAYIYIHYINALACVRVRARVLVHKL